MKSRRWNGEVLKPNAPGRDPIVSRILWLRGTETSNRNAANRFIYIHGTTEENRLGKPASYGCVRMGMKDVVDLFNNVNVGAKVIITKGALPRGEPDKPVETDDADGSPSLQAPAETGQPLEIAKVEASDGEKKRAAENEAKAKIGPEKPASKPSTKPESKSKSKGHRETKVAGQNTTKSKAKA